MNSLLVCAIFAATSGICYACVTVCVRKVDTVLGAFRGNRGCKVDNFDRMPKSGQDSSILRSLVIGRVRYTPLAAKIYE